MEVNVEQCISVERLKKEDKNVLLMTNSENDLVVLLSNGDTREAKTLIIKIRNDN